MLTTNPKKLEPHSKVCLFVGYPKETKGDLFYDPKNNKVFVSTNTTFSDIDHRRDHKLHSKLILSKISNENNSMLTRFIDNSGTSTRVIDGASTFGQNSSQELKEPRCIRTVMSPPLRYMGLIEG